ncbi:MAG: DNA-directed RNA polymerase subunit alpha C-terminal domain-containing protein [Planctomycetota bacterium]
MSNNPMEMVIGAGAAERDAAKAKEHSVAGQNLLKAGDRDGGIAELRKAVAADPSDHQVAFRLAFQLDLIGQDEEAVVLYERICEDAPAHVNSLLNLAVIFEDRGDLPRAERCLRQILETNPNHPKARMFMKDVIASKDMVQEEEQTRDVLKRNALLDTPVTDFELSVRTRTCLKKMNIRTLGDLLRVTEAELMSSKNFGDSSLDEIKAMLATKNLKLGQGLEDAHRAARRRLMEQLKGTGKEIVLGKPVGDLQLSVRARKALQLLSVETIGDLASRTEHELMGVKNFGQTSLDEIREKLGELGLSLRALEP